MRRCLVLGGTRFLGRHVAQVVERRFAYRASADPTVPAPLGVFLTDDEEGFIV